MPNKLPTGCVYKVTQGKAGLLYMTEILYIFPKLSSTDTVHIHYVTLVLFPTGKVKRSAMHNDLK